MLRNQRFITARTDKSRRETEEDDWLQGLKTGWGPILYLINQAGYPLTL